MLRRAFVKHAITALAWLTAGVLPYGMARLLAPVREILPHTHLRPPGALEDEANFIAACIGCGECGEVCPPRCIAFYDRDGGAKINTPYINPEAKGCILCGKCMPACPTDALTEMPIRKIRMGIAQIDRAACYPWVDRGICGACVTVCPLGTTAIDFDFANIYRPVVQKGCVGCGLCVEVCPEPSLPIRIVHAPLASVAAHTV